MKKIISGLMLLFAALTLTSCIEMTSETTLSFEKLPEAVIIAENAEGDLYDKEILINIKEGQKEAQIVTLKAAEQFGAVVEGAEYKSAGYHTLLVTYKDVTIAFTYLVVEKIEEIPSAVDTSWYNNQDQEFILTTAAQLRGLAQLVNTDEDANFAGKTVKLGADIDLTGYPWTPIGEGARKENGTETTRTDRTFKGTFDGNGYVIKNLSDAGYVPSQYSSYTDSYGNLVSNGYVYGLFGMINASNVEIRNVKLENVKINGVTTVDGKTFYADAVAGIVGYSGHAYTETISIVDNEYEEYADIKFINCSVTGSIKGYDATAALVGRTCYGRFIFENCKISVDLYASRGTNGGKMGGLIASWTEVTSSNNNTDPLVFVIINDCEVSVNFLNSSNYQGKLIGHMGAELGKVTVKVDNETVFDNEKIESQPLN